MIQKKEFNNIQKQNVLSLQKHKCKKCNIRFGVANIPEFGYIDGNISNNNRTNIQALCPDCMDKSGVK